MWVTAAREWIGSRIAGKSLRPVPQNRTETQMDQPVKKEPQTATAKPVVQPEEVIIGQLKDLNKTCTEIKEVLDDSIDVQQNTFAAMGTILQDLTEAIKDLNGILAALNAPAPGQPVALRLTAGTPH
jgi:hypothetical protein